MTLTRSLLYTLLMTLSTCSQSILTIPGHAHNDYEHEIPLFQAIENGFISVEADVHLINNELFVSHDAPAELNPEKTLEALYLKPLKQIIENNKGEIYKGYGGDFYLFVDVKTEANATYEKLKQILEKYKEILSSADGEKFNKKNVTIVLSGNRAIDKVLNDDHKLIFLDGRPQDLEKNVSSIYMPVISENYNKYLTWKGEGGIDTLEKEKFLTLVSQTHQQGKKLRLWASPENERVWTFLLENGANLINTDKLIEFNAFMMR